MILVAAVQFLVAFLSFGHVASHSTNRTIDDELGDSVTGLRPVYSPPGAWDQGATCTTCSVKLSAGSVFGGTWHDSTHRPGDPEQHSITMRFNGTAVYVYNVVANTVPSVPDIVHGMNMTFSLDGAQVGTFSHIPTNSTDYLYNQPVFISTNLQNIEHTLVVQTAGDNVSSLILFDCVVYTFTDEVTVSSSSQRSSSSSAPTAVQSSESSSHSRPPVAAIAGGTVGGAAALLLPTLLFILLRRRARRKQALMHAQDESTQSSRGLLDYHTRAPARSEKHQLPQTAPSVSERASEASPLAYTSSGTGYTSSDVASELQAIQSQVAEIRRLHAQAVALRTEREMAGGSPYNTSEAPPNYDDVRGDDQD